MHLLCRAWMHHTPGDPCIFSLELECITSQVIYASSLRAWMHHITGDPCIFSLDFECITYQVIHASSLRAWMHHIPGDPCLFSLGLECVYLDFECITLDNGSYIYLFRMTLTPRCGATRRDKSPSLTGQPPHLLSFIFTLINSLIRRKNKNLYLMWSCDRIWRFLRHAATGVISGDSEYPL